MKICVFLTCDHSPVLGAYKTIFKSSASVKIIDRPICDLKAYLSELEKKSFKQVIIRYHEKISFHGIFIDLFLLDPTLQTDIVRDIFKYGSKESCYLLSADYDYTDILPQTAHHIVNFGLSMEASVTASSITEDNFLCSITRPVLSVYQKQAEQQEILVSFHPNYTIEQMLMIMATLIVLGFIS